MLSNRTFTAFLLISMLSFSFSLAQIHTVDAVHVNTGSANGVKFWGGQDVYAINMGQGGEFLYGTVSSWAMKFNNFNSPGRGWVFGPDGATPTTSISTGGKMQIASDFRCMGKIGVGTTSPSEPLDVVGTGTFSGNIGVGNASVSYISIASYSSTNAYAIQAYSTDWNSMGGDVRGGSRGLFAAAGVSISGGSQPLDAYGLWGFATGGQQINCGVHGDAIGTGTDYTYGVWGESNVGGLGTYGVFGEVTGTGPGIYAGYFSGDVYTTGSYLPSDRKLKDNIENLNNATDLVMQLRPATYNYKTEDYPNMNLASGKQMGFIAEEMQEVFPNLVKATVQPPEVDKEGHIISEGPEFVAVNYTGLIPALTATIQEQQEKIEQLEESVRNLEQVVMSNKAQGTNIAPETKENRLFQNTPNPFSEQTEIRYNLHEGSAAQLIIFDMNGRMISSRDLQVVPNGAVTIQGHELDAGMYIYTLIVDGQEVDSRRMILTN